MLLATYLALAAVALDGNDAQESPIGRMVADFTLADYRGKTHSLDDYDHAKAVVLVVLGTECPLVKLYAPRLVALSRQYADRGVVFLGINANRQDTLTEIAAYARRHELPFTILRDARHEVVDQIGAVRTPEVFLLDGDRRIRYWGRIDDQYGVGYIRNDARQPHLQRALDAFLAGQPIARPVTESVGCHIGRPRPPDPTSPVTFASHVAEILQRHCVECHREGEIAPFALTEYDDVAGWAETIAEVVRDNLVHADGDAETVLDVPAYDFNWQTAYRLTEPKPIPLGTAMHCVAHFDNSAENLANPDPNATVRWGPQTWDEMMIGYFDVAVPRGRPPEKPTRVGTRGDSIRRLPESARLFQRLDRDGDQRITHDELPTKFAKHFDAADGDGDESISRRELLNYLRSVR